MQSGRTVLCDVLRALLRRARPRRGLPPSNVTALRQGRRKGRVEATEEPELPAIGDGKESFEVVVIECQPETL